MEPIVTVPGGQIRGISTDGVTAYLGIPYAAAPVGPAAFEPPRPVVPWDGIRDSTVLGPTAPQPPYEPPYDVLLTNPISPGPDFLNLNVWTPGGSGRPVMVWFHGGAFRNGSNATPGYDGSAFARDGVVLVSVNYRLGVQGFGVVEDAPSNRGLLDQLAALRWVRDTIAVFGGDPDQVTIFGQSAGGMSVATLMSIGAARGLFRRAIVQSGTAEATAVDEDAALVSAEVAKRLGVPLTSAGLGSVAVDDLIGAQRQVALELRQAPDPARWGATTVRAGGGIMPFFPVIDGDLIHGQPLAAIRAGSAAGVDLVAGTTRDEFNLFTVPAGLAIPAAAIGDAFFQQPTLRLVEAHQAAGGAAYVYQFVWESPIEGLGACHALELPFVFDTLSTATSPIFGTEPPQELADRMHEAWVAFGTTGSPGWPQYDATTRAIQHF